MTKSNHSMIKFIFLSKDKNEKNKMKAIALQRPVISKLQKVSEGTQTGSSLKSNKTGRRERL